MNEDPGDSWDWILIGTGSEVHSCLEAASILRKEGARTRFVSMPSWEIFFRQDDQYQRYVIPELGRKAVEKLDQCT